MMWNVHRIVANTALTFGRLIMKIAGTVEIEALNGGDT
jgi:hypothetical protein